MLLQYATELAEEVRAALAPYCEKIDVAGSVRRCKYDVNDIDIVLLPSPGARNRLGMAALKFGPVIAGGFGHAARSAKIRSRALKIELWMPQAHDYARILCIRTGSAEWVHENIAKRWVALGWVGTEDGLRRREECVQSSGTWKCRLSHPSLPPAWRTEDEFLTWLGLPWTAPENRK